MADDKEIKSLKKDIIDLMDAADNLTPDDSDLKERINGKIKKLCEDLKEKREAEGKPVPPQSVDKLEEILSKVVDGSLEINKMKIETRQRTLDVVEKTVDGWGQ